MIFKISKNTNNVNNKVFVAMDGIIIPAINLVLFALHVVTTFAVAWRALKPLSSDNSLCQTDASTLPRCPGKKLDTLQLTVSQLTVN